MHIDDHFDFTQLDTVTHVLDLEVLAGQKYQFSPVIVLTQIAGAVDQLGVELVERILHKGLCRLFRVAIIAQGQTGAANADLALLTLRRNLIVLIQQDDLGIAERTADGHAFLQTEFPINLVIAADAGGFCRAIEVNKPGIGQSCTPQIELLDGENLAGKGNGAQMLRLYLFKGAESRDHGQRRNHPAEGIDLMLV